MNKKITIFLFHPTFESSQANKILIDSLKEGKKEVEMRNVYDMYPDGKINVENQYIGNCITILSAFSKASCSFSTFILPSGYIS